MEDRDFMVVRIRFGRGPVVARRKGKNSRIALLGAGFLTLVTICLAALSFWRVCQDLGLAGDFIFVDGFLSHWQVWIAATFVSWYLCWKLSEYAKLGRPAAEPATVSGAEAVSRDAKDGETPARLAANM